MDPLDFCKWLQGFAELTEGAPNGRQWQSIREHLQTVFTKITPPVGKAPSPARKAIEKILRDPNARPFDPNTPIC